MFSERLMVSASCTVTLYRWSRRSSWRAMGSTKVPLMITGGRCDMASSMASETVCSETWLPSMRCSDTTPVSSWSQGLQNSSNHTSSRARRGSRMADWASPFWSDRMARSVVARWSSSRFSRRIGDLSGTCLALWARLNGVRFSILSSTSCTSSLDRPSSRAISTFSMRCLRWPRISSRSLALSHFARSSRSSAHSSPTSMQRSSMALATWAGFTVCVFTSPVSGLVSRMSCTVPRRSSNKKSVKWTRMPSRECQCCPPSRCVWLKW
mmetsp:Transcript_23290/g.67972  ORF Transcript_23290/g.67972 Transcript_23290/m.67972 type:complete len:267 (-) Transcript_23290:398-1198(-)